MKNIKCIILAAGAGTRMNTKLPKPLHKIGNKTMLERLIETISSSGVKHITAVVGYKPGPVENILKQYAIKAIRQKKLLGSADAVKATKNHFAKFNGSILVLYTDTPLITTDTVKGLMGKHMRCGAACTLLSAHVGNPTGYGRIIRNASGSIVRIVEEKDATDKEKNIKEVNIGAYCFKRKELFDTLELIKKNIKKGEFYLTDIIAHFRDKGITTEVFDECKEEEALGINSRQDLSDAEKIIRKRKISQLMEGGVSFIDPDTAYIDERTRIGKDTVIYPSVLIDGEVTIGENCHIGPFASIRGSSKIGENCTIGNFVEIVRSNIGSNAKVKHHAYLGDAYVGNDVNIGAGVITANYDGKNKNKTTIKDKAFIGVGAVLIAPVRIGRQAMVGAGSVVTKNKNVPDKATVVGVPAKPLKRSTK